MNARQVRSFVRREGRLTPAQLNALRSLWPRYGLEFRAGSLDLDTVFGRGAPKVLEIGFGNGDALLAMAAQRPDVDFIGIEVHRPGVGSLLRRAAQSDLDNLRVSSHDAVEVLRDQLPSASLAAVHLYFPDPWPKKRHHKRRIVQPPFVALVADRLEDGGIFHLATDWEPYAEWMREVLDGCAELQHAGPADALYVRPTTKFERRGTGLGHSVKDFVYKRRPRACEAET